MPLFRRSGTGLEISLEDQEAALLRELLEELRMLLEADIPPRDAVIQRIFPAAYDDPEDAEKYRGMVQDDLRKTKIERMRTMRERLGSSGAAATIVPGPELAGWLSTLTDLRLAIGTRLEVTEDTMAEELDPSHPDHQAIWVLHWLGWVQESMLAELNGSEDQE